ncbi:response regulator [Amphibiibacter pelophylacis]|uniref:Response regulator n=1 Tax=Amphibiibacter pelophylacis TaxID=1799477 RepID=A0ACC6P0F0_9BURK
MPAKGKILAVDDDRLVLLTVVHGLTQAGFEVLKADNGDEAILLAREHRPDLALLDIRMQGKNGFDVAQYLRDALDIPFVFLSAFADPATLAEVERLGALAYLTKPLDIARITPIVERACLEAQSRPPRALPPLPEADVDTGSVRIAPAPVAPAVAPAEPVADPADDTLPTPVALAAGIVMHRHSLDAAGALAWLRAAAQRQGLSLAQMAQQVIAAVQTLSRPG